MNVRTMSIIIVTLFLLSGFAATTSSPETQLENNPSLDQLEICEGITISTKGPYESNALTSISWTYESADPIPMNVFVTNADDSSSYLVGHGIVDSQHSFVMPAGVRNAFISVTDGDLTNYKLCGQVEATVTQTFPFEFDLSSIGELLTDPKTPTFEGVNDPERYGIPYENLLEKMIIETGGEITSDAYQMSLYSLGDDARETMTIRATIDVVYTNAGQLSLDLVTSVQYPYQLVTEENLRLSLSDPNTPDLEIFSPVFIYKYANTLPSTTIKDGQVIDPNDDILINGTVPDTTEEVALDVIFNNGTRRELARFPPVDAADGRNYQYKLSGAPTPWMAPESIMKHVYGFFVYDTSNIGVHSILRPTFGEGITGPVNVLLPSQGFTFDARDDIPFLFEVTNTSIDPSTVTLNFNFRNNTSLQISGGELVYEDETLFTMLFRKRPDLLQSEWEDLIDVTIETLSENPLAKIAPPSNGDGGMTSNPMATGGAWFLYHPPDPGHTNPIVALTTPVFGYNPDGSIPIRINLNEGIKASSVEIHLGGPEEKKLGICNVDSCKPVLPAYLADVDPVLFERFVSLDWDPREALAGQELLAHELTHVVQQATVRDTQTGQIQSIPFLHLVDGVVVHALNNPLYEDNGQEAVNPLYENELVTTPFGYGQYEVPHNRDVPILAKIFRSGIDPASVQVVATLGEKAIPLCVESCVGPDNTVETFFNFDVNGGDLTIQDTVVISISGSSLEVGGGSFSSSFTVNFYDGSSVEMTNEYFVFSPIGGVDLARVSTSDPTLTLNKWSHVVITHKAGSLTLQDTSIPMKVVMEKEGDFYSLVSECHPLEILGVCVMENIPESKKGYDKYMEQSNMAAVSFQVGDKEVFRQDYGQVKSQRFTQPRLIWELNPTKVPLTLQNHTFSFTYPDYIDPTKLTVDFVFNNGTRLSLGEEEGFGHDLASNNVKIAINPLTVMNVSTSEDANRLAGGIHITMINANGDFIVDSFFDITYRLACCDSFFEVFYDIPAVRGENSPAMQFDESVKDIPFNLPVQFYRVWEPLLNPESEDIVLEGKKKNGTTITLSLCSDNYCPRVVGGDGVSTTTFVPVSAFAELGLPVDTEIVEFIVKDPTTTLPDRSFVVDSFFDISYSIEPPTFDVNYPQTDVFLTQRFKIEIKGLAAPCDDSFVISTKYIVGDIDLSHFVSGRCSSGEVVDVEIDLFGIVASLNDGKL